MQQHTTAQRPLTGRVAVVTGASRGAGRGIARRARRRRRHRLRHRAQHARAAGDSLRRRSWRCRAWPRCRARIDDTAERGHAPGGRGIAVRCDHTREDEVRALFERVQREQGRLDLLVNNAWGGHETFDGVFDAPFWEHPLAHWDSMFDRGVRNHLLAAAPPRRCWCARTAA